MRNSRQIERRERFQAVFQGMPRLETWTEEPDEAPVEGGFAVLSMYSEAGKPSTVEINPPRRNFRLIPRRVQREMARERSRREFREARGLPEERTKEK